MAVGDAFGQFLGAATESRQPAAGVEERVTVIAKLASTDTVLFDDATTTQGIVDAATLTNTVNTDAKNAAMFNLFIMITNTNFITKNGSTDTMYICGVQTNA